MLKPLARWASVAAHLITQTVDDEEIRQVAAEGCGSMQVVK
jgi:hypothetical protein